MKNIVSKITILAITFLFLKASNTYAQHVGIVRKNYYSTYYDSILMMNIDVFDSATCRLGSINPNTGAVTNLGNATYNGGINLNGATIDPYLNRYYIGSGSNLLTIDINSGNIISNVPISGSLASNNFQNFRFNTSDSTIYGLVPNNFYSSYYDSVLMMTIDVLDSTQIRFAAIHPSTGQYIIIGNTSYSNLYTLAGNSIDPYQMLYYYSAVDTLIGIDLYTGAKYSAVPIQLPPYAIFENIAYSCADTSIYGITRQNYVSTVYDSLLMDSVQVIDSTAFRISKINPNTGVVTFISPNNISAGGNLTGGAFIDPGTMTYYFSNGNQVVGASLASGQITSSVNKTFADGAFAFDMMRSTQNCFGAARVRQNTTTAIHNIANNKLDGFIVPNPAQNKIELQLNKAFSKIEILDFKGSLVIQSKEKTIDITSLPNGIYIAKVITENGAVITSKFVKK